MFSFFGIPHTYRDDNPTGTPIDLNTITVYVKDNGTTNGQSDSKTGSGMVQITVNNVVPTINSVTAPVDPVATGTPVNIVTSFSDPGTLDTLDCKVAWSDGVQGTASASASGTNPKTCTVSGPLLDRIDLHIEVPALAYKELRSKDGGVSSAEMRDRVQRVRATQLQR